MKKEVLLFLLAILLFLFPTVNNAQKRQKEQKITINQGQFIRGSSCDSCSPVSGTFVFQNDNSRITGKLSDFPGGAVFTSCPVQYGCTIGQTVHIYENISGITKLRQDTDPIIINGISYPTVYYSGELTFEAGTIRIPYRMAKRNTFKLTFPAKLTGYITGNYVPISEPFFTTQLNLLGTVTVTFTRQTSNSSTAGYIISGEIYDFPANTNNK